MSNANKKSSNKAAVKFAAKKATSTKRLVPETGVKVSFAIVDGYQVYGSPVQPKHLTPQQIAEAVQFVT